MQAPIPVDPWASCASVPAPVPARHRLFGSETHVSPLALQSRSDEVTGTSKAIQIPRNRNRTSLPGSTGHNQRRSCTEGPTTRAKGDGRAGFVGRSRRCSRCRTAVHGVGISRSQALRMQLDPRNCHTRRVQPQRDTRRSGSWWPPVKQSAEDRLTAGSRLTGCPGSVRRTSTSAERPTLSEVAPQRSRYATSPRSIASRIPRSFAGNACASAFRHLVAGHVVVQREHLATRSRIGRRRCRPISPSEAFLSCKDSAGRFQGRVQHGETTDRVQHEQVQIVPGERSDSRLVVPIARRECSV